MKYLLHHRGCVLAGSGTGREHTLEMRAECGRVNYRIDGVRGGEKEKEGECIPWRG